MYDVMCGEVWENVTKNLAQKIGGTARADALTARHWRQFARDCGLNPGQVLERVRRLAEAVLAEAPTAASEVAAMPAGSHAVLEQVRQAVERRAKLILAQLQEGEEERAADQPQRDVPVSLTA
jgi:serine/threonine-protein kinase HipA